MNIERERTMTDDTPTADANHEVAALREENESLRKQLDGQAPRNTKASSGPLWRRIVAWVLAVLAVIAVVSAVDAIWLKTFVTDTDAFVSTLEPLPQDEDVAAVLSVRVADGIVEVADVEVLVADTLPDQLTFLAAPLTEGISSFTTDAAYEVVTSDGFTTIWTGALTVTHKAVTAVLSGNDGALVAEGGRVAIDLDEAAAVVVERIEARGLEVPALDETIELGEIVILESEQLAAAQSTAQAINTAGWFLPFLALLLIAGAIFAAPDRRHMTAVVGFATSLGLLLSLAVFRITRSAVLNDIEEEATYNAAAAVWDTVLRRLIQGTWALLMLAFIVGLVAWLAGPSPRAEGVRAWYTQTVDRWRRPEEADPGGFAGFITNWKRTIQAVIVVLGLGFVLFGPSPSGWLVLLTTLVVLALVTVVEVLGGPNPAASVSEPEAVAVPAGSEE